MSKLSYTWRMRQLTAIGVVATIAVGLAAGAIARTDETGENFWFVFPALLALGTLLSAGVMLWWRSIDDVQKMGQVNSWYLGGCAGALVFFLYLVADRAQHSEYGQGAFAMFMAQFVGYALMWGVWKLRGMGHSE